MNDFPDIVIAYDFSSFKWIGLKRVLILIILCLHYFYIQSPIDITNSEYKTYVAAKESFKWLTTDLYLYVITESKKQGLEPNLVFALIQNESGGHNVISRVNTNNTRDYGYMQINTCWCPRNPRKLMNPIFNIGIGVSYLKQCLIKSKGSYRTALRYYNAGMNSRERTYKKFNYVSRILNDFILASL